MTEESPRSFNMGPDVERPWMLIVLAVGCLAVVISQIVIVLQGAFGARYTAEGEAVWRLLLALVFVAGMLGFGWAVMSWRNAEVQVTNGELRVRDWRGREETLDLDQVAGLELMESLKRSQGVPFSHLTALTGDGEAVFLGGGLWPEAAKVRGLRRNLIRELDMRLEQTEEFRALGLFPGVHRRWRRPTDGEPEDRG